LGEKAKAQEAFKTALQLRPDFTEAHAFLQRHFPPEELSASPA
jgi:hypothetical protein